ncbi:aromatic amino acid transaminase [Sphingomonas sp. NSE70-1]|uniref:Aromatic amino acid transaminase n=1 Tax=Sphingomonas caseinilyticus TaxID=2908205 RepID=A0ABT0RTG7_9SPHN|nr:aromatic amino acid transaminase [Sphingomonas caseinilyticus]MCL6698010.1 aromatic amino acid transaminase [Sphingomonas caseinilyticus]
MLDHPTMTGQNGGAQFFDALGDVQSDSLLALIAMANADPRTDKIDVGVGVYRDGVGNTPILRAVKAAEKLLWEQQQTKSYIGGFGDKRYTELLRPIVLGRHAGDDRIIGLHTPGGCGALSLGFKLIATAHADAKVHVGTPTWPNHIPVVEAAGLNISEYRFYDKLETRIRFDEMISTFGSAPKGDVVLLHGCCHNPTGADLDEGQWREVVDVVSSRGLIPLVDIAYQGLGRGFAEDAAGLHLLLDACDEVVIAQSCDKNFGVYRDRVGSMFLKTATADGTKRAMDHVVQIAREMWSMPPDHGAAAVRIVLDTPELRSDWDAEVGEMRARINRIRGQIAASDPRLAYIGGQFGMFSMLPLSKEQVVKLREQHAIYMADSGRFNVIGMADHAVDRFIGAVIEAMNG